MILFLIYTGAGLYMLALALGILRPSFIREKDPYTRSNMRLGLALFGFGMLMLGAYYGYLYLYVRPAMQEAERTEQLIQKPGL